MKLFLAIVAILILTGIGSAETYQLGSHNVSVNLSVPANYTLDDTGYASEIDTWFYQLRINPHTDGYLTITIQELNIPWYGSKYIQGWAQFNIEDAKTQGLGGYKYKMITYSGHDAFEEYIPAQKVYKNGQFTGSEPEKYLLTYQLDERTVITVRSIGSNKTLFYEILDSMEITKNSSDRTQNTDPWADNT